MDVQSLIIEGGAKTLELFINAGMWDEARIFTSDISWGKGIKAPSLDGIMGEEARIGEDTLRIYYQTTF